MLLRVREGSFDPQDGDLEPDGEEIWCGETEGVTISAFINVEPQIQPGEWYKLDDFKTIIKAADETREVIFSSVATQNMGVIKPWDAVIGVKETDAALMMCHAVLDHITALKGTKRIWIRVE